MKKNIIFKVIILLFGLVPSNIIFADDIEVPMYNQIQILQKLLSMETRFQQSNQKEIVIGVLYQSQNKTSNKTNNTILEYVHNKKLKVGNSIIIFVSINVNNNLNELFNSSTALDIVMVTQLRSINLKEISNYSRNKSILTFATSADVMKKNNFSLAIGFKGNNPQPIINLKSLRSEGYSFPSQVLKISNVLN
jgi:hypothetical protein